MNITYVENLNGKLFSFHRHDFRSDTDKEETYVMIDGGLDYTRYSGELHEGKIKDLMPEIREQFIWGQNYDENNNRLEETIFRRLSKMSTSHIAGALRHMLERGNAPQIYLLIFIYELENRLR